jgi:hypothetical protein
MPLIDCGACGRQISSEAISCPQCGHPNRSITPVPAGHKLQWSHLSSAAGASEADVHRAFTADLSQSGWITLTGPDGASLFTMVESGAMYSLQHSDARTEERLWAQGRFTLDEVREAFLQFRRGDPTWRTSREWGKNPALPAGVPKPPGCGPAVLLLAAALLTALAAFT